MATVTQKVRPKQPEDERRILVDWGPFMLTGDVMSSPTMVKIEERDTGADYTGAMYVAGSMTFSSGGVAHFDVMNGSDNKDYAARVRATLNPGSRTEDIVIIVPVRLRPK